MRRINHLVVIMALGLAAFSPAPDAVAAALGPKDGGGGKGYRCQEQGRMRTYLADTYAWLKGRRAETLPSDPSSVMQAALAVFNAYYPEKVFPHPFHPGERVSLGWMVEYTHARLQFSPRLEPLPDFPDDHIADDEVPAGCAKVQIALQDIPSGIVYEDFDLEMSLTFFERGFLELHETLVALRNRPGMDTTPIRGEVKSIAEMIDDPHLSIHALVEAALANRYWSSDFALPARLECQVTSVLKNDYGVENPGRVVLQRYAGTELPYPEYPFGLSFGAGPSPEEKSDRGFYYYDAPNGPRVYHSFQATWDRPGDLALTIGIDKFLPQIGLFRAHLQLAPREVTAKAPYSYFGLLCEEK